MTEVKLHGLLGKEFGSVFKVRISKPSEVLGFLEANKPGFRKKLRSMSLQGMHYTIIVDGKKISDTKELNFKKNPKKIDLVPIIVGSGPIQAIIITIIVIAALVFVVLYAVNSGVRKQPKLESSTRALAESFYVSNKANLTQQGTPVPVGYGRLLVGTNVIESTEKNYPQNKEPLEFYKNGTGTFSNSGSDRTQNPVAWPKNPPLDYRGWIRDMQVNGTVDFYWDPNTDHTGFAGGEWLPLTHPQSVGSISYSMANTGTGFVNVYITYSTSGGYIPYAVTLNAQSLGPGQTLEGFLGQFPERFRTDWGSGEAKNRITAAIGSKQRGYGAADRNVSKGFKGYGGQVSRTGGRTMFMYMVPAGLPFSLKDKSNVIAEGQIRVSTKLNVIYWDNKTFADNPPSWDPVYPNRTCNGQACHQNQTPDQPAAGCYLPGWNAGLPFGSDTPSKPCGAGGSGPVFRQNTDIGGIGPQVIIG